MVEKVNPAFLSELWGLEQVLIAEATYRASDGSIVDIWGNDVVLAYTVSPEFPDLLPSSYGGTFYLETHPELNAYLNRDNDCNTYSLSLYRQIYLHNADAGYLIQATTAV